ncbi:DUF1799 domain-containing protein [Maritimibacter alkaliphilus]|uniref:DUF1799 domain-containing protein n=1 Tax=Maritimibacter alkaliphilus TaxID=404236 RepID=UPI001C93BCD3|nr:DUF1799 domain-containing protein [Maritimibacter alkaliphilus]MBY6091078.1 DUF1799 domain-containing protein [Maritimibacter alkaliphilus]
MATTPDEDVLADFQAMGLDLPDHVPREDDAFEIWPENWHSLIAWIACETQWRVMSGSGGNWYLGLDYTAVDVVMRRLKLEDEVFADLQEMERTALATFAESD